MDKNIFRDRKKMPVLALICSLLWALAYPFIKLGYNELGIPSNDLGSKILFAGIRFLFAGILVLLVLGRKKLKNINITKNVWRWLLLFALVNTSLHYLFSYVGLGYIPSSRGTIIDSTGSFFLILLSCLIFSDDNMTVFKAAGCILGFSGIVIINVEPGKALFDNVSFLGDGMLLFNALCAAFGGIISKIISRKIDMTAATGMSMAIGGGFLCIIGLCIGTDNAWHLSVAGVSLIIALTLISAISFSIYNSLLAYHPISNVAIFNAFIPIFGVFFSCFLLGESYSWKYIFAAIMVALGIYIVNSKKRSRKFNTLVKHQSNKSTPN